MKKKLPIILLVGLGIFLLIFAYLIFAKKEEPVEKVQPKKEVYTLPIDQLPEDERPVITLSSRSDGKELTLKIENIKEEIKTIEYELVYLTEGVQRGVIGSINLKEGEDSVSRDLPLGTCSRGVCRYDEDVTGGTLSVTFRAEKIYKYVEDFRLEKEKGRMVVVME